MMWFNNALIYQYELDESTDLADLLSQDAMKPCPPHARFIYGWLPAIAGEFIHEVAGSALLCMGKEERLLPRGVINKLLAERVEALETQRGYAVKRAEKGQIAEDLEFELLPKAFCMQKRTLAMIDTVSKRLIINASSANQAAQLTSLLRKSVPGMSIVPLQHVGNLSVLFAQWIIDPASLPVNFQLASDCLLFSLEDDKKRFNCKGYELPAEEILTLLSQGLAAAEISVIWNERIQFTLTHELTFKRLKCLDYLVDDFSEIRELDEEYEQQDASLTLLSGELRLMINDLLAGVTETAPCPEGLATTSHAADEVASCPF